MINRTPHDPSRNLMNDQSDIQGAVLFDLSLKMYLSLKK